MKKYLIILVVMVSFGSFAWGEPPIWQVEVMNQPVNVNLVKEPQSYELVVLRVENQDANAAVEDFQTELNTYVSEGWEIDPVLTWNTFMGSASTDYGRAIAVDTSGNVYVGGYSYATWGSPINAFSGNRDVFAAKFDSSGERQWHTFMGSADNDYCRGIAVDANGNVYVGGYSYATWGSPINAFAGGTDAFVAKLNSSGERQWHTFMGSAGNDYGRAIAADASGNVYAAGYSNATWGTPVNAYAGGNDAFVAKFSSNGIRQWHAFMGSASTDYGRGIAVDTSENVYVAGFSLATWGTPVNAHAGSYDAFAAKLNSNGIRQWHTFMGSSGSDEGYAIAADADGNVYVTGLSNATWGIPIYPYTGGQDAFAAKLNSNGIRVWNTFMGSAGWEGGNGIVVDASLNVYVAGESSATWGTPLNPYAGGYDAFAVGLNSSGERQWNTFMGSASNDYGDAVAVDMSCNVVYMAGRSYATWGTPVTAHAGDYDAFAAKLGEPDCQVSTAIPDGGGGL